MVLRLWALVLSLNPSQLCLVSGVAAEGGETPDSAGEVEVFSTLGCTGDGELAAPLPGTRHGGCLLTW